MEILLGLVVFFLIVFVLFRAVQLVARALFGANKRLEAELGMEALQSRLAGGEITPEEFEVARRALGFGDESRAGRAAARRS